MRPSEVARVEPVPKTDCDTIYSKFMPISNGKKEDQSPKRILSKGSYESSRHFHVEKYNSLNFISFFDIYP